LFGHSHRPSCSNRTHGRDEGFFYDLSDVHGVLPLLAERNESVAPLHVEAHVLDSVLIAVAVHDVFVSRSVADLDLERNRLRSVARLLVRVLARLLDRCVKLLHGFLPIRPLLTQPQSNAATGSPALSSR